MSGVPVQQKYTIDALNTRAGTVNGVPVTVTESKVILEKSMTNPFVWYIVMAALVFILLWIFKPAIVQSVNPQTGQTQLDWGKVILWSLIFALGIFLLLWLTRGITGLFK